MAGDSIEGMTPAVVVPAMLSFQYGGNWITRQVQLIGIDERTQGSERFQPLPAAPGEPPADELRLCAKAATTPATTRPKATRRSGRRWSEAGWAHRREMARMQAFQREMLRKAPAAEGPTRPAARSDARAGRSRPVDPFARGRQRPPRGHPVRSGQGAVSPGVVLGIAMASYRTAEGRGPLPGLLPGDDVKLTFPTAGMPPKAVSDNFTVVDFYESKMSEYDASFVFVPIRKLQELRGMIDPSTGVGLVNSIQIKLKPGADGNAVRDKLRAAFAAGAATASTPGATSRGPCWPPCRWRRPSSTCCCS